MLREISWVTACCSSSAAATAVLRPLISSTRSRMVRIASTVLPVESWMPPICWAISSVALAV
jgi:hypothetical protein